MSKKALHTAIIAEKLYFEGELSTTEICEQLSISRGTLDKYLRQQDVEIGGKR